MQVSVDTSQWAASEQKHGERKCLEDFSLPRSPRAMPSDREPIRLCNRITSNFK